MGRLYTVQLNIDNCAKEIAVFCDDVTAFAHPIDILTTSAFVGSYDPTPRTVFHALYKIGISVQRLAKDPEYDLRDPCHIWVSKEIALKNKNIKRIGCVELIGRHFLSSDGFDEEQTMINSIRSYFHMLDIAAIHGVDVTTVALPLLGGGRQNISGDTLLIPLINECIAFLKRNPGAKNIYFIELNPQKAEQIANCLQKSLRFSISDKVLKANDAKKELAFISYSSKDKNIADNLCSKLERKGIKVWYAPRDVKGPYAEVITKAIEEARYFIVILSQNSIASEHVLNEIDLAFQNISRGIKFKPLRIDNALFTPSFKYYLSRQHWMDATVPPLEQRLDEFVVNLISESKEEPVQTQCEQQSLE